MKPVKEKIVSLVRVITWPLVTAILLLAVVQPAQGLSKSSTYPDSRVIAGSDSDFMMVRHVVLRGSNFEIGQQMASFAQLNGISITPAQDSTVNKLRRNYLKEVYPAYFERMKGLAEGFGQSIENDGWDFSILWQPMAMGMGCSMVYCPGRFTDSGHGMLCRNYDFTTGTISGQLPDSGFLPVNSRPILFEIHPDDGYASLAMCDFELLGGVLDGVNSEGMTVAIAADDETSHQYGRQTGNEVGLHELLCMRYLLDNCANVQEAKEAMLSLKHFYTFIPCHYLIADRNGQSFIFEFSSQRNQSHITDGSGPQIMTNHPVFSYADTADLPEGWSYDRFRILHDAFAGKNRYNASDLVVALSTVQPMSPVSEDSHYAPLRTLWNAIYDSEELTLTIKFYLGETRTDDGGLVMKYSKPLMIKLTK
jgi:predicted choloylglycine hydrolase